MTDIKFKYDKIKATEIKEWFEIVADGFIVTGDDRKEYFKEVKSFGPGNKRCIRDSNKIIAVVGIYLWNHYFGGRKVQTGGISDVGVLPAYRRKGAAHLMMSEVVRELHRDGVALSSLYGANGPLYRKSGYENAVERIGYTVETSKIGVRNTSRNMLEHKAKSSNQIQKMWEDYASTTNGNIERTKMLWNMTLKPWWHKKTFRYSIKDGKKYDGYVVISLDSEQKPLYINDYVIFSREAGLRLLTFLSDFSTSVKEIKWTGGVNDPLAMLLPNLNCSIKDAGPAMFRITHVPNALQQRGYPKSIESEIHFEIYDDIIPENNGSFVLNTKNGRGKIRNGGKGHVKADIRSLVQLYTGYMSPVELKSIGQFECRDSDIEPLSLLFNSGPHPWIRNEF